jgi:hypothetical protein
MRDLRRSSQARDLRGYDGKAQGCLDHCTMGIDHHLFAREDHARGTPLASVLLLYVLHRYRAWQPTLRVCPADGVAPRPLDRVAAEVAARDSAAARATATREHTRLR